MIDNSATEAVENPTPDDDKLLLTVEEAAHRLGIGRSLMYRLVLTGTIESVTLGKLRRIPSECLTEFVDGLRHNAANSQRHTVTS